MSQCAHGTFFGPVVNHGENRQAFARADCKRLVCKRCGPRRAIKYRRRVTRLAIEHKLTRFVTLTLDPRKLPFYGADDQAVQSVAYIKNVWAKFRVCLSRYLEGRQTEFKFICVAELQPISGNAHLHIVVNQWIDKAWLSKTWQAVGGGWSTRIEYADIHCVSAYISKYLTKDVLLSIPRGKKRITSSRGLRITEPPKYTGWRRTLWRIDSLWPRTPTPQAFTEECRIDDAGLLYFELRADQLKIHQAEIEASRLLFYELHDRQQSILVDVAPMPPHDQE